MKKRRVMMILLCGVLAVSCAKKTPTPPPAPVITIEESPLGKKNDGGEKTGDENMLTSIRAALDSAAIPAAVKEPILASLGDDPSFIIDLLAVTSAENDPMLRFLVDKTHPLPEGYAPTDLVELGGAGKSYKVSRAGLQLRREAEAALEEMASAARQEGVALTVSSAYRSFDYQVTVYNRIVKEMGQEAADRESARPGYSQHQTGLAVDFGSISDAFAETAAGKWLVKRVEDGATNASRFGWSISFPDGYEKVTGYRWESWHYRYMGLPLAHFIETWFGGIQQYALAFVHEWEKNGGT